MRSKGKAAGIIIILLTFFTFCGFMAMMVAPREKTAEEGGLRIIYNPEKDGKAGQAHLILAEVNSTDAPDSLQVNLYYYRDSQFKKSELYRLGGTDYFGVEIPGGPLGSRIYYYLEAVDGAGNRVVLPETATDDFQTEYDYFKVRFEGKASFILLVLHIVLMMAALFLLIHALYYAIYYLQTGEKSDPLVITVNWGIITFFITGFPIGWVIEKQVLGNYWEGIPFGWDITDSKTLIILVLWLIFIILRRAGKISLKTFARWVIINTIITILLFLIPHSL
ncbi:MAG: hypothetical protein HQ591_00345 [candidate division Zixibacteria bacterium]|nr:hypothetical protein [Candidatus Tariuqbacter arcticus]